MKKIKIVPSIDDNTGNKHKPFIISRIFWHFGYLNFNDNPIARKHKLTGKTEVRYYNETFQYWCWVEVYDKYKSEFISKKYWC